MKLIARITSWVLIVAGGIAIIAGTVTGVIGMFARIAIMRSVGRGLGAAINEYFSIVFWAGLFAGLLLLAMGMIIAMQLEILREQKIHLEEHASRRDTPMVVVPEPMPEKSPVEPEKPQRSRKIAG